MATELTSQVLDVLSEGDGPILTADAFASVPFITMKSALDRLGSRDMVVYKALDREEAILTEEAEGIAAQGSHEAKVFEAVRQAVEGLKIADLSVRGAKCTPAGLKSSSPEWKADSTSESCGQRKCKTWAGQGSQCQMDQDGQGKGLAEAECMSKTTHGMKYR